MIPKVSVVVPVYNPGTSMERCLQSLSGQSLPPSEVELIFVDDGSTDQTPQRLATFAAAHPQARIITIPNSGWPGKPRNVGTDAAAGEYVMFLDQDDALEPQSLARMYALGSANGADVVLGKVISDFREVHHNLYRVQRPRCDVFSADLLYSLTPHKMLRTEFLRQRGIRYPEGPRRLEDQLFMTQSYFAADAASIVADYVCYRYLRRSDGRNAGAERIEPGGYYRNLREILDVVDAHTQPGAQRDDFYRRFLRSELLRRLRESHVLKAPPEYLVGMHAEVRALLRERFPLTVDEGLGVALRSQAVLARFGTIHEMAEQRKVYDSIRTSVRLTGLRQIAGHLVELDVEAELQVDGEPVPLERGADGWLLAGAVAGPGLSDEQRLVEDVSEMSGDVVVRHRETLDEWFLPGPLRARIEADGHTGRVIWSGTAVLDAATSAGGEPLRQGLQDFFVRLQGFGVTRNRRLGDDRSDEVTRLPLLVDRAGQINQIYDTQLGNLSFNVDAKEHWVQTALRTAPFLDAPDGQVVLDVGVVWETPPTGVLLTLTRDDDIQGQWPMRPETPDGTRWRAEVGRRRPKPGSYQARLTVPGLGSPVELDAAWVERRTRRVLRRVLPRP